MCTVTLNINEAQARKYNPSLKDMESITRWAQKIIDDVLADNHISHSKEEPLKPYTIEEINAMLDEAEANFAAGKGIPHEESMRRSRERLARTEAEAKELTLRRGRDIKAGRAKLIPHEEVMREMDEEIAHMEAEERAYWAQSVERDLADIASGKPRKYVSGDEFWSRFEEAVEKHYEDV